MDLSTNQELTGTQNRYATNYGNHMFEIKETYEETDIKGNNNMLNSLKTETNSNHAYEPSSLFQVNCTTENKLEVDNSLFSYSSFKKAMDLRTHNRTRDGRKRTIFDDAEYFAKNYCYKLLPITFEQVDETIIQSEHNYSLSSLNSESEPEEDCSRTMDYSQIKEKNYKRRRTKFREEEAVEGGTSDDCRMSEVESSSMFFHQNEDFATEHEHRNASVSFETENSLPVQPLDLRAPPLVQEEKTDHHLRERPNSIVENDEVAQPDSDKENVNSELSGIRVTITRPDEKENYQPCDLFLNDIARLVPWLIDKDCFEVDILDRTCDHHDEFRNHRLYYVISESTWRLFQGSNERVILTNDQSLGQPLTKADKSERPSYLVFDQFSLAKCLADYCKEIGGCFEYTCVEEGKDAEERSKDELPAEEPKNIPEATPKEVKKVGEMVIKGNKLEEAKEEKKENDEMAGKKQQKMKADEKEREEQKVDEELESSSKVTETVKKEIEKEAEVNEVTPRNNRHEEKGDLRKGENEKVFASVIHDKTPEKMEKSKPKPVVEEVGGKREKSSEAAVTKEANKQSRGPRRRKESLAQPEANNCRITTRSKSTSGSETSQKSDKPVNGKGRKRREASALPKEPPKKRSRPAEPESLRRKTRSGGAREGLRAVGPSGGRKRERREEVVERRLRSHGAAQGRGEGASGRAGSTKARARRR